MKIKLSKTKWEEMGKKAGWIKMSEKGYHIYNDTDNPCPNCGNSDHFILNPSMPTIQECTKCKHQWNPDNVKKSDSYISKRRSVKVTFSDGDHLETWINGTVPEILKYYMPEKDANGKPRGPDQDYSDANPKAVRHVVDVKFLD